MRFGTKEHSIQVPKCNGEAVLLGTDLVTNMEIIRFPSVTHAFKHSTTKSLPETSFSGQLSSFIHKQDELHRQQPEL